MNTSEKLQQALALHRAGEHQNAYSLFCDILKSDPKNAVCLYSIAAIESMHGHSELALEHINVAIEVSPNFAPSHLARSVILYKQHSIFEAKKSLDRAYLLEPTLAGLAEHAMVVNTAIETISPEHTANNNEELRSLTSQAIELQSKGDHLTAQEILHQALALSEDDFIALYSLGVSQNALGQTEIALQTFTRACNLHPDLALGFHAKAKTLHELGLAEAALEAYDRAITLDPQYMDAHCNKAALLQAINRHHDALVTLTNAIEINPNHAKAYEGQGLLLNQFKQFELSTKAFQKLLEIDPNYDYALGNLMGARLHNCDWTDYEETKQKILEGVRAGKLVCNPMTMMAITDDIELTTKCVKLYAKQKYTASDKPLWKGEVYQHRKKKIAFLSGDFRTHPVGYLLIGLIENLDKNKFEIIGISNCISDNSDLWKRYRCAFDQYIDCYGKTSLEVAKLIRCMEIDIAIDLSGHTEGTRLDVLAHRPAPIQASYLGFPGTTGLYFIDFLISDDSTTPEVFEKYHSEKVLKLPTCYLPREPIKYESRTKFIKKELSLPDDKFILCSFNHDYKINPEIFKVWMELMNGHPNTILWLMKLNDTAPDNLLETALKFGISKDRIIFANRVPKIEDHLARYSQANLFLDSYPYNGHTTAGDAILAKLPIVTLKGESFASRVAASILSDIGLSELIADSLQEYKMIANKFIEDEEYQFKIKSHLLNVDWPIAPKEFASNFEQLLINMRSY